MVIHQNSFYDFLTTPIINPKNHIQHRMLIIPPFPPTKHEMLDSIKQKIIQPPPPPPPTDQALQKFRTWGGTWVNYYGPPIKSKHFLLLALLEGRYILDIFTGPK